MRERAGYLMDNYRIIQSSRLVINGFHNAYENGKAGVSGFLVFNGTYIMQNYENAA